MKKLQMFFMPLFALVMFPSCDEDDDTVDVSLIRGHWEAESGVHSDAVDIYNFMTSGENTYSWGDLEVYQLYNSGVVSYGEKYDWSVSDPVNTKGNVTLSLLAEEYVGADDAYLHEIVYRVDKLTSKEMSLSLVSGDGSASLVLHRRHDLDN